jgi:hypothetical protein
MDKLRDRIADHADLPALHDRLFTLKSATGGG